MGTRAAFAVLQEGAVSAGKLGLDVHLRIPKRVADAIDELVEPGIPSSRNAFIVQALKEKISRKRHAHCQANYRARRQRQSGS